LHRKFSFYCIQSMFSSVICCSQCHLVSDLQSFFVIVCLETWQNTSKGDPWDFIIVVCMSIVQSDSLTSSNPILPHAYPAFFRVLHWYLFSHFSRLCTGETIWNFLRMQSCQMKQEISFVGYYVMLTTGLAVQGQIK